ncbi:hypothetical protein C8J56DRAFT_401973 [Mycena floridula]|nr:hypothetical protein C8J56DRAFT_401973 [Mycena floridula]
MFFQIATAWVGCRKQTRSRSVFSFHFFVPSATFYRQLHLAFDLKLSFRLLVLSSSEILVCFPVYPSFVGYDPIFSGFRVKLLIFLLSLWHLLLLFVGTETLHSTLNDSNSPVERPS